MKHSIIAAATAALILAFASPAHADGKSNKNRAAQAQQQQKAQQQKQAVQAKMDRAKKSAKTQSSQTKKDNTAKLKSAQAKAKKAPNFFVAKDGTTLIAPKGSVVSTPMKGQGLRLKDGQGGNGLHKNAQSLNIMAATKHHPQRAYYTKQSNNPNEKGQKVDPYTGKTISNNHPMAHIYFGKDKKK